MAKVYVVTSGEYSNYRIDAVFDNRDAAEVFCALGHGEMVEEYDLLTEASAKPAPRIVYRYHVRFPPYRTDYIAEPAYVLESEIEADKQMILERKNSWLFRPYNIVDCSDHVDRYVYLKERNKSKALKIVQDRIAEYKAKQAGI